MVQESSAGLAGVAHIKAQAFTGKVTAISDLPARLSVKRRLVEHHHALFARIQLRDTHAFLEQRDDLAAAGRAGITDEPRLALDLDQAVVIHAEGTRRACTLTLGLHLALEAFLVQRQLTLAGDVAGEVYWETVGVVQLEDHLARNDATLQLGEILLQNLEALLEGFGELLFLILQHALDMRLLLLQLGEGFAHFGY